MSVLTTIGGIPLFSTSAEALTWAQSNGLTGIHTHLFQGVTGYMGGSNHAAAVSYNGTASSGTQGANGTSTSGTNGGSGNTGGY